MSREAVAAVGALFGVEAAVEPYEPAAGESVHALSYRSVAGTIRIVLWPSLQRVDVRCGPHTWVAKAVRETEVIEGLEVIFHTEAGATLFVALTGDVLLVTGPQG